MAANTLGLVAAITAFLSIWIGHVVVRKIEFRSPTLWLPSVLFAASGLVLEYLSTLAPSRPVAASLGIIGITLLWDTLEFTRQQQRVRRGHAPANPANPRHVRILEAYPAATRVDRLKREPVGRIVSDEEAIKLLEH